MIEIPILDQERFILRCINVVESLIHLPVFLTTLCVFYYVNVLIFDSNFEFVITRSVTLVEKQNEHHTYNRSENCNQFIPTFFEII